MTDVFERASDHEAELRADALENQAIHAGLRGKTFNDSALLCRVCDEKIPLARRRALPGVQTCIECQGYLENELKTGRGAA